MSGLSCRDYRALPLEELPGRLAADWANCSGGLLSTARRPRKRWTETLGFARALILSSAPQFEIILWVPNECELPLPKEVAQEQEFLLDSYGRLLDQQSPQSSELLERYSHTLRTHIHEQEAVLFPELVELAPIERAARELGYEHRGLEKGMERLPEIVRLSQLGELDPHARERFSLDFYHLLEHHLERERDALYPARAYLQISNQRDWT